MSTVYEKLKYFDEVILKDAASERNGIMKEIKKEAEERIALEKNKCRQQADELFKKENASIENEKNNIVSMAIIKSRQMLMKTREEIMESVSSDTRKLLYDFTHGEEYFSYLCEEIKKSCIMAGTGELIVYASKADIERFSVELDSLKKDLPPNSIIEETDEDIIGGCMVFNRTMDIMVNGTLLEKLKVNMDIFFEDLGEYGGFII